MPDIAVVIPCYNAEPFLDAALASVFSQTRPVARALVVDDGSTDRSREVVEAWAARGYQVGWIRTPANRGPGTARNLGVASVVEPVVAFLDADDYWERTHCEALGGLLDRFPDVLVAFAETRSTPVAAPDPDVRIDVGRPVDVSWPMILDNLLAQSAAAVRRSAFQAAGGYVDGMRYSEDYDLWLRLSEHGPFATSGEVTCIRRMHDGQATRHARRMYEGAWRARARAVARRAPGMPAQEMMRLEAALAAAYERDLTWAWQSRSWSLLRHVLTMSPELTALGRVRRRWSRRSYTYWPLWRLAAAIWDVAPASLRERARALRPARSTALSDFGSNLTDA